MTDTGFTYAFDAGAIDSRSTKIVTNKYEDGTEDIMFTVESLVSGMVRLNILLANGEKLYGAIMPPETARKLAMNLTMQSIKAEER